VRLLFPAPRFHSLSVALLSSKFETCAIVLVSPPARGTEVPSWLVRETYLVPDEAYVARSADHVEISPEFLIAKVNEAKRRGLALAFVHTHPDNSDAPEFSPIDDESELRLAEFLARRMPDVKHVSLVLSKKGSRARLLGTRASVRVLEVGGIVRRKDCDVHCDSQSPDRWDRQILAFGQEGQRTLQNLKLAIVGLGGTGSIVAQQLAYLGVKSFVLVDPDVVDSTNLNRVVGAATTDVGLAKVAVTAANIWRISPEARIDQLARDVTYISVARRLIDCDAIFGCTDSHSSRAILNQLAYQYLVPLFDLGVSIGTSEGTVNHIAGRIQMGAPGLACLVCTTITDPQEVRRELMTETQRAADPYFVGGGAAQPAVISLNGTVSSLAVTMFMSAFLSVPSRPRIQFYDGLAGTVRAATAASDPSCVVCSLAGSLARGDEWPLAGRADT
jgi:molybdopterin/thiamine biosynthesis adenylyltransferase